MSTLGAYVPLAGSERAELPGAQTLGPASAEELLQVTVVLRGGASSEQERGDAQALLEKAPAQREHLTREEFAAKRGALPGAIEKVTEFAREFGLAVVESDAAQRTVKLSGAVANFSRAFQVKLYRCQHPNGTYRGRTGAIYIPAELQGIVAAVLGLDNRPQASPHFRIRSSTAASQARPEQAAESFTPPQVGALYNYPASANGKGQCIALIELGGGFRAADVTHYFTKILKLPQHPKVTAVAVDGGTNSPVGTVDSADGEVLLDIEVAGAVAPQSAIAVYFAPNTDQGFYNAISSAVHDAQNDPSVISISWGGPESSWTQQSLTEFNTLLEDAGTLGITVCVAAGDNGSADGVSDGLQHADFPASSPYALACGGTKLVAADNHIGSEVVWNETASNEGATGGGISAVFAKPSYQANAKVPVSVNPGAFVGRGLPDVAGDADPTTGYEVYVDGQSTVVGGTSAVAPLWAGLIACVNELMGKRVGFLNSALYGTLGGSSALHDVTSGNNGAYSAGKGWDPCTGWGSPDGTAIASALGAIAGVATTAARRS
jgi:kumamolisin